MFKQFFFCFVFYLFLAEWEYKRWSCFKGNSWYSGFAETVWTLCTWKLKTLVMCFRNKSVCVLHIKYHKLARFLHTVNSKTRGLVFSIDLSENLILSAKFKVPICGLLIEQIIFKKYTVALMKCWISFFMLHYFIKDVGFDGL